MERPWLLLALVLLSAAVGPSTAIKLKFQGEECLSYTFQQYEYFYGSFVSMPDVYGSTAKYDLTITAPSQSKLYEVHKEGEATFHLVPVESGSHKFCLKFNPDASPTRYVIPRDVLWNINIGYSEGHDKIEETDTQYLWHHVYQIDGQVQELKSTLHYLYWRERRHRETVESTHKRTMLYAFLRCAVLIGASVGQVFFIRRMFSR
ncbi:Emp24/gp25L/p24 family protein [Scenedesmus sp. NREL 46B-D3]|nr:Emp24/gp25L/p24 family protein [Scenedesmus sp. NREL 46B-D3]